MLKSQQSAGGLVISNEQGHKILINDAGEDGIIVENKCKRPCIYVKRESDDPGNEEKFNEADIKEILFSDSKPLNPEAWKKFMLIIH